MMHCFDIEIAQEYGINCAVLLENMRYWIEKNKANRKNYHDGYYWTYNSVKAFAELFPYISPRQISTALNKLEESGLIITGNYNDVAYDRTTWYAITEKGFALLEKRDNEPAQDESKHAEMSNAVCKNVKCNMQNCEMEHAEMSNAMCGNVEPIANINTNINTDINAEAEDRATAAAKLSKEDFKNFCCAYNENCSGLPKVLHLTDSRKKKITVAINELKKLGLSPAEYFSRVSKASFLRDKHWLTFEWLLEPEHIVKLVEGAYDVVGRVTLPAESSLCNENHMKQCNQTVVLDTQNLSAITERMKKRAAEKKAGSLAG